MALGALVTLAGGSMLVVPALAGAAEGDTSGQAAPPAELGSYSLKARAPGIDIIVDSDQSPSHPAGQGAFPEAASTLDTGAIGTGFSSVAWPGPLAGNFGSVIAVGGGPAEAEKLNSPVRATAQSPGGPADATNNSPGVTMESHADPKLVSAHGSLAATDAGGAFTTASTDGRSKVTLDGAKGAADSISTVSGFVLGPLKIDAVTSTASAVTDGVKGTGTGATTVSGVSVAGQSGTIDESGIHFGSQGQPNPITGVVNQAGETALKQAGITATLVKPVQTLEGAKADVTSGSVLIVWKPQAGTLFTIALGGATAVVDGTPGFDAGALDEGLIDTPLGDTPVGGDLGGGGGLDAGSGDLGDTGASAPALADGGSSPSGTTGGGPTLASGPTQLTASSGGGFSGLPVGLIVLAVGGSLLAAGAFRRLADDVLTRPASTCNLEGPPR